MPPRASGSKSGGATRHQVGPLGIVIDPSSDGPRVLRSADGDPTGEDQIHPRFDEEIVAV